MGQGYHACLVRGNTCMSEGTYNDDGPIEIPFNCPLKSTPCENTHELFVGGE